MLKQFRENGPPEYTAQWQIPTKKREKWFNRTSIVFWSVRYETARSPKINETAIKMIMFMSRRRFRYIKTPQKHQRSLHL